VETVGQIVGPTPSWLDLGPPHEVKGVSVRDVLGDWSHLPECDQPPKYMLDGENIHPTNRQDKGDDREAIKQTLPGRHISELQGIHSGKCAILFNGESMGKHDLYKIDCPIIGMNRTHKGYKTYQGPQPDYLCIVDHAWICNDSLWSSIRTHPKIINGSTHFSKHCPACKGRQDRDVGYRVMRNTRMAPFSFDLGRDGYIGPVPGTTGFLALQVAVYMGFTEIYCLGLDMGGLHFDGTKSSIWLRDANRYFVKQSRIIKEHGGIEIYLCGSPESQCTAFPHASFEELMG